MRSHFTPQVTGAVIQAVRSGLTIADAAERAGLSPQLLHNWLSRGRRETDTEHSAFAIAVDEAREAAQTEDLTEEEFRARLNRSVRAGSVQAMRLWWAIHGDRDEPRPEDELDALVARRNARRASLNGDPPPEEAA